LQQELESVGDGKSVAAGDVSHELVDEKFSKGNVDGRGGLEIADGSEDIAGDEVAFSDAANLTQKMVMAKIGVAGIDSVGAAFVVGAQKLATAVGREWDRWWRDVRGSGIAFAARSGELRGA